VSSVTVPSTSAPGPSRARRWLSGFRDRETWTAYLFIFPWIFGFLVLTLGPMIFSAYYSFTNYGLPQIAGLEKTKTVGTDNYSRIFHDTTAHLALKNTFVYTLMMVPARIILALLLAMMLMRVGEKLGGIFRTIFYIPHITPPVAVGVLLIYLFNGGFGIVNKSLGHVGIKGPYWIISPHWIKPTIALMDIWACGGTMVILLAALYGVPKHLYEAAAMDGASKLRQFFNVTLPMISPALFFVFIILTLAGLNQFAVAYTAFFGSAGGVGSTGTNSAALLYAIYLFKEAFQSFEMGYASALAWVLFGICLTITGINVMVSRRLVFYQGGPK
jgi:multiple sugar transport system permease protein